MLPAETAGNLNFFHPDWPWRQKRVKTENPGAAPNHPSRYFPQKYSGKYREIVEPAALKMVKFRCHTLTSADIKAA